MTYILQRRSGFDWQNEREVETIGAGQALVVHLSRMGPRMRLVNTAGQVIVDSDHMTAKDREPFLKK